MENQIDELNVKIVEMLAKTLTKISGISRARPNSEKENIQIIPKKKSRLAGGIKKPQKKKRISPMLQEIKDYHLRIMQKQQNVIKKIGTLTKMMQEHRRTIIMAQEELGEFVEDGSTLPIISKPRVPHIAHLGFHVKYHKEKNEEEERIIRTRDPDIERLGFVRDVSYLGLFK